jgi:ankyrin repeat protein
MKTQSSGTNSKALTMIHSLSTFIVFIAVFAVTACNSQQKSENKTASAKAPDVDIHTAVVSGNLEALKQHIAAGTNINEKDPFGGSSPLISASVFGKPDAAKLLIDAGADVNFQNNDGSTALHTAAFFCHPEIIKMLLAKNADKTIKNKYGATAYESVAAPFESVKGAYDMMGQMLGPMGLKLDYAYIQKTRPEIAATLK